MTKKGELLDCDQALRLIERIEDPVTKNLVNMAFVQFIKKVHVEKSEFPSGDFDMPFLVGVLRDFFAEHDVIARTLEGETVGAWFEEEK